MLASAAAASRGVLRVTTHRQVFARGMAKSAALDYKDPLNWQSLLTEDEKMIQVRGGWLRS